MALHAVECSFVAGTVTEEGFLGPMACFDTTVFTNNVISLLLQFGFECKVHAHGGSSCSRIPLLMNGWERLGWIVLEIFVLEESGRKGVIKNT